MANTREFSGKIVKESEKDITNLVIPFILIQLACQDLYYINNIMKIWLKVLSNPYYFAERSGNKNNKELEINKNSIKFVRAMKKYEKYEKLLELHIEGVQFCLISDYINIGNNIIIDLLIDNLIVNVVSNYTEDRF
jgi:hypothetical protein